MHAAVLLALSMVVYYVSDRHVMVLVLCGSYLAVAGLIELPRRVLAFWRQPTATTDSPELLWHRPAFWTALLLAGVFGFCLPKTLERLHGNRAGNHAAGLWLAERVREGDLVLDDHCWSHFYAGQLFEEGKVPVLALDVQPVCYVVMTRSRDSDIDAQRKQEEQKIHAAGGSVVYHWPERAELARARVVVYRRPRDFASHPWTKADPRDDSRSSLAARP
jgi:hypothetical protein